MKRLLTLMSFPTVEDYPTGYPRFAALLNSHASFYTFRNFSKLRLRVLLGKQDKLAQLEDRMEEIDDNPDFAVIRGTFRRDINGERDALLALIDKHLADYGTLSSLHSGRSFQLTMG